MNTDSLRASNNVALERMIGQFANQDKLLHRNGTPNEAERNRRYAQSALAKECADLAGTAEGGRNAKLFATAAAVANLVAGGGLGLDEAKAAILNACDKCGLMEADERNKTMETIERAFRQGLQTPRSAPKEEKRERQPGEDDEDKEEKEDDASDPLSAYATVGDLIKVGAEVVWLWQPWIPRGVLTILAAAPGIGKTRFCMDLCRRISKGLPWPDGQTATCPLGSRTLWVPADNQHAELATISKDYGIDPGLLYLNAKRRNPYIGTMLDGKEDVKAFEKAIAVIKPQIVFIDTTLNATDRSAHKPEDAKAFFKPLQEIAQRQQVAIICVTHLNADGKPLGKRIEGQGRVVIQLEHPDPDNQPHRRKLYVTKTNSLVPVALGVTMFTVGNDYDTNPPRSPADGHSDTVPDQTKTHEAAQWLKANLEGGQRRVSELRTLSEVDGISAATLYRAKTILKVVETQDDKNKKWWKLPVEEGTF